MQCFGVGSITTTTQIGDSDVIIRKRRSMLRADYGAVLLRVCVAMGMLLHSNDHL
jgi:hypothetical protein